MEKYEIPISTLNRILQSQESILKIVDSQASLKIPKSACISQLRLYHNSEVELFQIKNAAIETWQRKLRKLYR